MAMADAGAPKAGKAVDLSPQRARYPVGGQNLKNQWIWEAGKAGTARRDTLHRYYSRLPRVQCTDIRWSVVLRLTLRQDSGTKVITLLRTAHRTCNHSTSALRSFQTWNFFGLEMRFNLDYQYCFWLCRLVPLVFASKYCEGHPIESDPIFVEDKIQCLSWILQTHAWRRGRNLFAPPAWRWRYIYQLHGGRYCALTMPLCWCPN